MGSTKPALAAEWLELSPAKGRKVVRNAYQQLSKYITLTLLSRIKKKHGSRGEGVGLRGEMGEEHRMGGERGKLTECQDGKARVFLPDTLFRTCEGY